MDDDFDLCSHNPRGAILTVRRLLRTAKRPALQHEGLWRQSSDPGVTGMQATPFHLF